MIFESSVRSQSIDWLFHALSYFTAGQALPLAALLLMIQFQAGSFSMIFWHNYKTSRPSFFLPIVTAMPSGLPNCTASGPSPSLPFRRVHSAIRWKLPYGGVFLVLVGLTRRLADDLTDPVPHAMVITGIVVAIAATALGLAIIVQINALTGRTTLPEERE